MAAESDFHRYAGARPPGRRRTCPEIVARVIAAAAAPLAAVVAAGVADAVADSAIAPVAAAALLGSARANIAVQRYILGDAACGNDIGRPQEAHDFLSFRATKVSPPRCIARVRLPRYRRRCFSATPTRR